MPFIYDLKTDIRYLQGRNEGKLEGKLEGELEGELKGKLEERYNLIRNLTAQTDWSDEQIAMIIGTAITEVEKVRKDTKKKS